MCTNLRTISGAFAKPLNSMVDVTAIEPVTPACKQSWGKTLMLCLVSLTRKISDILALFKYPEVVPN